MGSILRKNSSDEDKVNRLLAIEPELRNENLCDYAVQFDTYDQAVEKLKKILKI